VSGLYLFLAFLGMGNFRKVVVPAFDHRLTSRLFGDWRCFPGPVICPLPRGTNAANAAEQTRSQAGGTAERQNLLSKQGNHRQDSERKRERAGSSGIPKLKAPRWRVLAPVVTTGVLWRLRRKERCVPRALECGDPPVHGQRKAVHCASLKLNRRTGTEPGRGGACRLSIEESDQWPAKDGNGPQTLCANAQPSRGRPGQQPHPEHPLAVVEQPRPRPKAP